jgi:hypothetical protein
MLIWLRVRLMRVGAADSPKSSKSVGRRSGAMIARQTGLIVAVSMSADIVRCGVRKGAIPLK